MKWRLVWVLALAAGLSTAAQAQLAVFACEPEWGSLARELGGERVSVYVATTALQDPHRVEARPSLVARARQADLLVCTGAELESGWLPLLLSQAGNARIQPGQPGNLEAAALVSRIEIPQSVDRSLGDIHPSGNPHVHLDPRNIARVAEALAERLARIDAAGAEAYRSRARAFQSRWGEAMRKWEAQAAPLKGMRVVVYHRDLAYFIAWAGLVEAGSLEPRPGIPPSTGHLAELASRLANAPARLILYSSYNSPRAAEWLSGRTHTAALMLPYTVGGSDKARDLFGLFDDTIARLLASAK